MSKFSIKQTAVLGAAVLVSLNTFGQVKKADKAFYKTAEYENAIKLYKEALAKGADAAYVNAQIAESYRLTNRPVAAEPFYKAAVDAGSKVDSIQYYYGYSLKSAGKLDSAQTVLAQYAQTGGNKLLVKRAKQESDAIPAIKALAGKKADFEISNVEALNTSAAEFSPLHLNNELYFTSSRNSSKVYKVDGTNFLDLFKVGDSLKAPAAALGAPFTDAGRHVAQAAVSRDGKMMVFSKSNDGSRKGGNDVDLYISRFSGGKWSNPEALPINSAAWDATPAFSADGKTLYFASTRPGGEGGTDLYSAKLDNNGRWGKVTNLGKDINTALDEQYPYASEDGKLYFASDGHPGFGNLDIFVAARDKDKKLTVSNLGAPINSTADDFGLTWSAPLDGYFASNRAGGKGDDDIYSFHDVKNELKVVKFTFNGTLLQKGDKEQTAVLPGAKVRLLDAKDNTIAETTTDNDGKFSFNLDASKNYTVLAEMKDYYTKREPFTTVGKSPAQADLTQKLTTIPVDYSLTMEKIKVAQTFTLDNIYYPFNQAIITDSAALELDKLVTILNDNPTISIELSAHTDSRGSADYNLKLSQRRAESAVTYIVSKGVTASRISAKGYGATKPVIENAATEEDFQKNRRTEFKVTKVAGQ